MKTKHWLRIAGLVLTLTSIAMAIFGRFSQSSDTSELCRLSAPFIASLALFLWVLSISSSLKLRLSMILLIGAGVFMILCLVVPFIIDLRRNAIPDWYYEIPKNVEIDTTVSSERSGTISKIFGVKSPEYEKISSTGYVHLYSVDSLLADDSCGIGNSSNSSNHKTIRLMVSNFKPGAIDFQWTGPKSNPPAVYNLMGMSDIIAQSQKNNIFFGGNRIDTIPYHPSFIDTTSRPQDVDYGKWWEGETMQTRKTMPAYSRLDQPKTIAIRLGDTIFDGNALYFSPNDTIIVYKPNLAVKNIHWNVPGVGTIFTTDSIIVTKKNQGNIFIMSNECNMMIFISMKAKSKE